ncbi:hypothetical protein HYPSUDRAFT_201389 [Hypholoma sublateritium FD-334 SS-4]|uniref:Mitochondrial chaperone BCS1-like ATPase lid domain-containing protein n=1 Tax=Hypholoma sublateritium (strain FD-334 SS-4) TaxID=945553 RepID=A0A0D2PUU1_HYPSF|nr:hypothetical protein HYPSUDRAFT_201389 [Hypholoma sublateritium FD-334 SS-4]
MSFALSATSLLSCTTLLTIASSNGTVSPPPPTLSRPPAPTPAAAVLDKDQFGTTNTAYLPPPPDPSLMKVKLLDKRTLAALAKKFADGLPDDEFSMVGLQGYLLKHKSQPEAAANGVEVWVQGERKKETRKIHEKPQEDGQCSA